MKTFTIDKFPGKEFTLTHPQTEKDFEKYYQLRWEVLRKPWNQPKGSELTEKEKDSIHIMIIDQEKNVIGVCQLLTNSKEELQVRSMAVDEKYRGSKLGDRLLDYCEEWARKKSAKHIILHARENAVDFYKRNGYHVVEKSYLLFDSIQHHLMRKDLL